MTSARSGNGSIDTVAVAMKLQLGVNKKKEDLHEIQRLYETLTDERSNMSDLVGFADQIEEKDSLFSVLFEEIYYRRLFATSTPTVYDRMNTWRVYGLIFEYLSVLGFLQFPNKWLWDLVDGFVNQFQSFCHVKATVTTKKDMDLLIKHPQAWSVNCVITFLESVMDTSSIIEILHEEKDGGLQLFASGTTDDYGDFFFSLDDPLNACRPRGKSYNVLGYFSIVGLLRVHCLLGNYQTGLDCLRPIDISQQGLYTSLIATHVTTIFHYGFANLMLARYEEAIKQFNKILVYIFNNEQPQQNEQMLSEIERMYALLAICLSLCPSQRQLIDENVNSLLMEKYGEKMLKMQTYDDDAVALYREILSFAWPAFSAPFAPSQYGHYEDEELALACPNFFGPSASSNGKLIVTHNQVEAVVAGMLKLKLK